MAVSNPFFLANEAFPSDTDLTISSFRIHSLTRSGKHGFYPTIRPEWHEGSPQSRGDQEAPGPVAQNGSVPDHSDGPLFSKQAFLCQNSHQKIPPFLLRIDSSVVQIDPIWILSGVEFLLESRNFQARFCWHQMRRAPIDSMNVLLDGMSPDPPEHLATPGPIASQFPPSKLADLYAQCISSREAFCRSRDLQRSKAPDYVAANACICAPKARALMQIRTISALTFNDFSAKQVYSTLQTFHS